MNQTDLSKKHTGTTHLKQENIGPTVMSHSEHETHKADTTETREHWADRINHPTHETHRADTTQTREH
jgi:hypothetical protein